MEISNFEILKTVINTFCSLCLTTTAIIMAYTVEVKKASRENIIYTHIFVDGDSKSYCSWVFHQKGLLLDNFCKYQSHRKYKKKKKAMSNSVSVFFLRRARQAQPWPDKQTRYKTERRGFICATTASNRKDRSPRKRQKMRQYRISTPLGNSPRPFPQVPEKTNNFSLRHIL